MTRRGAAGAILAVLAVVALAVAGGRPDEPREPDPAVGSAPAESLAIRLIAGARGADPVVCGLASVAVEGRYGRGGSDPSLETLEVEGEEARATVRWTLSFEADPGAVRALASALDDPDGCVRRLAAIRLGRTRSPAGTAALIDALADPSPATRRSAALGLAFGEDDPADEEAVAALLEALDDADAGVRASAAWALGRLEAERAIGALVTLLESDPSADVRRNAALALGEIE